jgi:hypothetical protein
MNELKQPTDLSNRAQNEWKGSDRIYEVTEGLSPQTSVVYRRAFNRFLDHIKIHDLQVLLDFSPKVIKQMMADYILYLRDEKQNRCGSIKVHVAAILHFFQMNNDDFNLTIRTFRFQLPSDDSTNDDGIGHLALETSRLPFLKPSFYPLHEELMPKFNGLVVYADSMTSINCLTNRFSCFASFSIIDTQ